MAPERIEAWLRVRDGQRFSRDMRDATRATRGLGSAGRTAGSGMAFAGSGAHRARQGFMAAGAGARWAAFGLGLAGAGAIKMGINFNATMESNEVALDQFLRSGTRTQRMLDELFEISAKTPFEFKDVTTAARKFLAFGFTAKDTTRYLMSVGNAVAGIGGGNDEIQRAIIALGQMQAKGKVMGQELLQLTELGIPAYQILKQELGLTSDQMKRVGDEGITARKGIEAIIKGMDKRFAGAAERQSRTFAGQWSTFKDYFRQTMGTLTKPIFNALRRVILPQGIKVMKELAAKAPKFLSNIGEGIKGGPGETVSQKTTTQRGPGGNMMETTEGVFKETTAHKIGKAIRQMGQWAEKGFAIAKSAWDEFYTAIKPAMPFIENVTLPLFKGLAIGVGGTLVGAFKLGILVLRGLAEVVGFVGKKMEPFGKVLEIVGIALGLVFGGAILKVLTFIPKLGVVFRPAAALVIGLGRAFGVAFRFLGKFIGAIGRFVGAIGGRAMGALRGYIGLVSSMPGRLGGIPARIYGIASRIVTFFLRPLRTLGSKVAGVLRTAMNGALSFLSRLPERFVNAGASIAKAIGRGIKQVFAAGAGFAAGLGRSIADWLNENTPFGDEIDIGIKTFKIPELALGSRFFGGGPAIVGERGPELVDLPSGSRIYPHGYAPRRMSASRSGGSGPARPTVEPLLPSDVGYDNGDRGPAEGVDERARDRPPQIIQLVVGRRVLAETMADQAADDAARR